MKNKKNQSGPIIIKLNKMGIESNLDPRLLLNKDNIKTKEVIFLNNYDKRNKKIIENILSLSDNLFDK